MDKLKALMDKKKGEKALDPMDKEAKMNMLKALHKEMTGMMSDELKNPASVKKVEVAAPDKEGLKAGLDKAKEVVEGNAGDTPDHGGFGLDGIDSGEENGEEHDVTHGMEHEAEAGEPHDSDPEDGKEPGSEIIGDQIAHEGAEGELSDEEIQHLESLLAKMKGKRK